MLIVFQKAAFQDANVCLFVFDCIYFNDVSLMDRCVWQGRVAGLISQDELPGKVHECTQTSSAGLSHWPLSGKSGQHGRNLAMPRSCPVQLLLLPKILGLAASQLFVLHPLNTLPTLEFPFYHFLEGSKS